MLNTKVLDHVYSTVHLLNGNKIAECMKDDFFMPEKIRQRSVKRREIQKKSGIKSMFDMFTVINKEDTK
jgi:hypothetical protein